MDSNTMKCEMSRLVLKKHNLEKQEAALRKILEIVEKQLLGLEVEGYQLASDTRMREGPSGDESLSEPEIETVKPCKERISPEREDLNFTKLDLDNRLDEMLNGEFFVEEDDEEETDDLMLL